MEAYSTRGHSVHHIHRRPHDESAPLHVEFHYVGRAGRNPTDDHYQAFIKIFEKIDFEKPRHPFLSLFSKKPQYNRAFDNLELDVIRNGHNIIRVGYDYSSLDKTAFKTKLDYFSIETEVQNLMIQQVQQAEHILQCYKDGLDYEFDKPRQITQDK